MPFYAKNDICLFHSHVPKTGGTSVQKFFTNNNFEVEFFGERINHLYTCQHRTKDDEELLEEIKTRKPVFSFTFIRNPLDRVFSEFKYQSESGHYWGKNDTNKEFDLYIKQHLPNLEKNYHKYDNHLRKQIEFVHENMKVYKFGDWEKMINDVDKIIPLENKEFPIENKSKEKAWMPSTPETLNLIKEVYKEDFELYESIK